MGYQLATVALGPLLYLQGKAVRRSIPRLPEPPGSRRGSTGRGPLLRLLIVGDSAAAGVGAAHQDEALLGRLVAALSPDFAVEWNLFAETGATTSSTLRRLREFDGGGFDVAVTSLGVNDITAGVSRRAWRARQAELRRTLRDSFGVSQVIVCGLPPVHGFPSLPQPLRWYLGAKARDFDRHLRRDVEAEEGAVFLSLRFTEDASLMAIDGFHPGPDVYREWGRRAGLAVKDLMRAGDGAPRNRNGERPVAESRPG